MSELLKTRDAFIGGGPTLYHLPGTLSLKFMVAFRMGTLARTTSLSVLSNGIGVLFIYVDVQDNYPALPSVFHYHCCNLPDKVQRATWSYRNFVWQHLLVGFDRVTNVFVDVTMC
jgi:hypothetical protein